MITITAKLRDTASFPLLEDCARLFSQLERRLFVELYVHPRKLPEVKREFIAAHGITARQFNSISAQLRGKVEAVAELKKLNLTNQRLRVEKLTTKLKKLKSPFAIHQAKRKLARQRARLAAMEADIDNAIPSLCFGSKALFRKQFNLAKNGYASHEEWLKDWQGSRASSFFVLGSADETCGNQSCQYRDGALHLRLPNALGARAVAIPVKFNYREADFLAALADKEQTLTRGPRKNAKDGTNKIFRPDAISYRFVREDDAWHVHASFETVAAPIITRRDVGCVGVDLNPWGLAVTRIDRHGNGVGHFDIPWQLQDRSRAQVAASIGDAVRQVVLDAKEHGVPVAVEKLDFTEWKKAHGTAGFNRMLSAFAYAAFSQMVRGRCGREGVELIPVNPAFTSVIGRGKFATGYGLGVHRSAAMVIARRALNFGEKLRTRSAGSALGLPARNRTRHVWHNWRRWAKASPPTRGISTGPKGSRGLQPHRGRDAGPDPKPPNNGARGRCAGSVTPPHGALLECGANPQVSRKHRSCGVHGSLAHPPSKVA